MKCRHITDAEFAAQYGFPVHKIREAVRQNYLRRPTGSSDHILLDIFAIWYIRNRGKGRKWLGRRGTKLKQINRILIYQSYEKSGPRFSVYFPDGTVQFCNTVEQACEIARNDTRWVSRQSAANNGKQVWLSGKELVYVYNLIPDTRKNSALRRRFFNAIGNHDDNSHKHR